MSMWIWFLRGSRPWLVVVIVLEEICWKKIKLFSTMIWSLLPVQNVWSSHQYTCTDTKASVRNCWKDCGRGSSHTIFICIHNFFLTLHMKHIDLLLIDITSNDPVRNQSRFFFVPSALFIALLTWSYWYHQALIWGFDICCRSSKSGLMSFKNGHQSSANRQKPWASGTDELLGIGTCWSSLRYSVRQLPLLP